MDATIWVALIAFGGTLAGAFAGVVTSNRLVEHRLLQLEKKVDQYNDLAERVTRVETLVAELLVRCKGGRLDEYL